MPPKRRRPAAAATIDTGEASADSDPASSGMSQPAKRFKPTVAANAEAIAALGQQMTGVDGRLESITLMLANLSAGAPPDPPPDPAHAQSVIQQITPALPRDTQNIFSGIVEPGHTTHQNTHVDPRVTQQQVLAPPPAQAAARHASLTNQPGQPGGHATYFTQGQASYPAGATAGSQPVPPLYQTSQQAFRGTTTASAAAPLQTLQASLGTQLPLQAFPGTTAGGATATSAAYSADPQMSMADPTQRHRHYTTGHLSRPHFPVAGWAGQAGPQVNPSQAAMPLHAATQPWDQPTTLQDLEGDPTMTRRVTEALHAMTTPFAAATGKHVHFPHQLVNRGTKKQKTALGELTLPEFLWGFIQLIKARETNDPDVPYMYAHLENITEDTKTYEWSSVRAWSEEVLVRVFRGKLVWSNSYEIDRLQTQFSHQYKPESEQADSTQRADGAYKMSDALRKAKPGPPCKAYQAGSCTHATDHIING